MLSISYILVNYEGPYLVFSAFIKYKNVSTHMQCCFCTNFWANLLSLCNEIARHDNDEKQITAKVCGD